MAMTRVPLRMAWVSDGAKGTVHQAHTAGDAFVVVDFGPAQLVRADGVHAAGAGAGPFHAADGVIGALIQAAAAFDALLLIDVGAVILPDVDRVLGAHVHAGAGDAALAVGGDADLLLRAGVAGKRNDVDQGRLIVFFRDAGLLDALAGGAKLGCRAQRQTAGQTQTLHHHRALAEHVVAVLGRLARYDFIGDLVDPGIVPALVGQAGHLGEYVPAEIVNSAVYTSHVYPSQIC